MRWTRMVRLTSALSRGRRSRVVLAPLCRRQVRKTPTRRTDDGVNKAIGPRGERGISRKPLRGDAGCFRCFRCEDSCACFFYPHSAHEAVGALGTRHPLHPLIGEGERFRQNPGRIAPRRSNACLQSHGTAPHSPLSSSALCAIAHWSGRSSIPESSVVETIGGAAYWTPRMHVA